MIVLSAVSGQRVVGEVASRITPDGVDVIGVPGRVVVLDEDRRTVQPVVMGLPRFEAASPQQVHLVESIAGELGGLLVGNVVRKSIDVQAQERVEHLALVAIHGGGGQTFRQTRERCRLQICRAVVDGRVEDLLPALQLFTDLAFELTPPDQCEGQRLVAITQ